MPGSSLGTARSCSVAPRPASFTSSGRAFDNPPAPTSWIESTGLSSPSATQRSMTSWQRRCISGLPRCTLAKSSSSSLVPLAIDDAAPPPSPMRMAGPPSTTRAAPGGTARLSTLPGRTLPQPPAIMIGLWKPLAGIPARYHVRKKPARFGRPNSLLNAAAPTGPSSMMSSGDAMRVGNGMSDSHGMGTSGRCRSDTAKPHSPAFGFAPLPVAPSSRISPPAPVAAPANGEMAVGWLCVSTLICTCAGSRSVTYTSSGAQMKRRASWPSITAALSW